MSKELVVIGKPTGKIAAALWAEQINTKGQQMLLQDVKLRYRGSILGPFWLTLSTLILVAAMGGIYARLFGMEVSHYLPFLTIGLVTCAPG